MGTLLYLPQIARDRLRARIQGTGGKSKSARDMGPPENPSKRMVDRNRIFNHGHPSQRLYHSETLIYSQLLHTNCLSRSIFSAAKNPIAALLWADKVLNTLQNRNASEQSQTTKTGLSLKKLESDPQMDLWLLSLQFTTKSAILCLIFSCSLWFYHMHMYP